ncbi:MAG: hypothetical protein NZ899_12770 [Thermoguttaceae bacterium]|nr:hypothetical protein [Thermoguttaceae bacterium]MDW8080089.1 hypothetical protein [Thermoguttaceae bacterium]
MAEVTQVVGSTEDLRAYIIDTFCSRYDLDPRFFELTEFPLYRRGQPVGKYFVFEGPRRLRMMAVWDYKRELLLFYGLNGQRIQTTRLLYPAPSVRQAA